MEELTTRPPEALTAARQGAAEYAKREAQQTIAAATFALNNAGFSEAELEAHLRQANLAPEGLFSDWFAGFRSNEIPALAQGGAEAVWVEEEHPDGPRHTLVLIDVQPPSSYTSPPEQPEDENPSAAPQTTEDAAESPEPAAGRPSRLSAADIRLCTEKILERIVESEDSSGQTLDGLQASLETLPDESIRAAASHILALLIETGDLEIYEQDGTTYVTLNGCVPHVEPATGTPHPEQPKEQRAQPEQVPGYDNAFTADELALATAILDALIPCKHPDQRLVQKELYETLNPDVTIKEFRQLIRRLSDRDILRSGIGHSRKRGTYIMVKWETPALRRQWLHKREELVRRLLKRESTGMY